MIWRSIAPVRRLILAAVLAFGAGVCAASAQEAAAEGNAGQTGVETSEPAVIAPLTEGTQPTVNVPILVFDREAVFSQSEAGKALIAAIDDRKNLILAENEEIFAALDAEEKELAELKSTLSTEEFTLRATAFDEKVTAIREEQQNKSRELQSLLSTGEQEIEAQMNSVIIAIAREQNAFLIFERQQVYLRSGLIDITNAVITGMDQLSINLSNADQGAENAQNSSENSSEPSGQTTE